MLELCHMCAFLRQISDLKDVAEKSFPALFFLVGLFVSSFLLPLVSVRYF